MNEKAILEFKINSLLEQNKHCLTLPDQDGKNLSPDEYFKFISQLAQESPSVALSFSMHLYTVWGLNYLLGKEQKEIYFEQVRKETKLFGSPNDPNLYFITSKDLNESNYPIVAQKTGSGYIINGFKPYVSLEPFVKYVPVYCYVSGYQGKGMGLALIIVDKSAPGVTITEDWKTISMKDTYSNTINFNNVYANHSQVVLFEGDSIDKADVLFFLFCLSICSVYYGISVKAVNTILDSCKSKRVSYTGKKLSSFPGVQFSLSEMIIMQETSYSQIINFCQVLSEYLVNEENQNKNKIKILSLITKEYVTKTAESIVEKAMKIQGISSIFEDNPLSELYRDVKAGRFHPPQTDIIYEMIAKQKLGIFTRKTRWL